MKKSILITLYSCLFFVAHAQPDTTAPYKQYPTFPPVKLLKADSASYFTKDELPKKKPVLLIVFSPDCEHCKQATRELVQHIDRFKNIQIVMATMMPFGMMTAFIKEYGLERFPNITVGKDKEYFLPYYYKMKSLPFLGFYNKKKELITVFEGSMTIDKILATLDGK